jgi:hypothetical protein
MRFQDRMLAILEVWHRRCAGELEHGLALPGSCRHGHAARCRELYCQLCGCKVFVRGDYYVSGSAQEAMSLIFLGLVFQLAPYWASAEWFSVGLSFVGSLTVAVGCAMFGSFFLGLFFGGVIGILLGWVFADALKWGFLIVQVPIASLGFLARLSVLSRVRLVRRCESIMKWLERLMKMLREHSADAAM